jgi:hypothetical protein
MYSKKPVPLRLSHVPLPRLCPVCGAVSYSREGIHPQCAEQRADASRMERVRAAGKTAERARKAENSLTFSQWHKRCPECQAQLHVRKLRCACGYQCGKKRQHPTLAITASARRFADRPLP